MDELYIDLEFLRKMCKKLKKEKIDKVSFTFLIGSCFPDILENIEKEMRRQFTLGYIEGQKEGNNDQQLGVS